MPTTPTSCCAPPCTYTNPSDTAIGSPVVSSSQDSYLDILTSLKHHPFLTLFGVPDLARWVHVHADGKALDGKAQLEDVAKLANELQPTGNSLATANVHTKVQYVYPCRSCSTS